MPFAITTANLIETMKQPGCPICIMERKAAQKAVDSFLWESMMDPKTRETAMQAYGFCPPHTRLLVAADLSHSGLPLASNILYEQLHGRTLRALKSVPAAQTGATFFRKLLGRLQITLPDRPSPVMQPAARCPICTSAEQSTLGNLTALFEEMEAETPDLLYAYEHSDGVCLPHLRMGLSHLAEGFPGAANLLVRMTIERLTRQQEHMREFIRKKNWEYREESLTEAESEAWRAALTFYTGYPGESFTHKTGEPD